jgi:ParB family chromosome partitioning protein
MKDRRYGTVPVEKIVVLNSRDREEGQFAENVKSIGSVGLLKPVLVNERFLPETGTYELVCGEGRLLAHRRLGKTEIAAELIDCDREEAYVLSLVENLARAPAEILWFAREMKRLKDGGMEPSEISRIVGKSPSQIAGLITLVERGEDRLLEGVERGQLPLTFALAVARSEGAETQQLLIDAFDQGLLSWMNLRTIRKIIKDRRLGPPAAGHGTPQGAPYTVEDLRRDIVETTRKKNSFVRESSLKEARLLSLVEGLKELRGDDSLMDLVRSEGLAEMPALEGTYTGLAEREQVTTHG